MALPPIGGTEAAYNANVPAYNAYFQGKVAADPSHLEVSGRHAGPLQRSQCEQRADGHQGHAPAGRRHAVDGRRWRGPVRLAVVRCRLCIAPHHRQRARLPDVPAVDGQPSQRRHQRHGQRRSVWNGCHGLDDQRRGAFAGTCSVVAADGGDPVTVPWQRVSITSTTAGSYVSISAAGSGRSITTSDPSRLEQVVQMRLNGLDLDKWTRLRTWFQGSDLYRLAPDLALRLGAAARRRTRWCCARQRRAQQPPRRPAHRSTCTSKQE